MAVQKDVRVRFAPSPTGELHIGGLRSALTDYLFARKNDGVFVLRIEDTDRNRLVEGAVERLIQNLEWAGIEIDEGVKLDESGNVTEVGEYGPYTQSDRKDIYQKNVAQLLEGKKAYHCFCSAERLDEMRKEQQKNKQAPKYDRTCCDLGAEEVQQRIDAGEKYVVRFKVPEGKTTFTDLVFGEIEVDNATLDDQVIMKSDGFPTYHLAVVVDDYLMKISHVFRGAEWIASTPKHVLLFDALGWSADMPEFCHMANILNKDKKKLSKREGSVSVADFRAEGYSKESIINFIALLGWNPKTEQEIFTMDELIEQFDTEKMNKAGGVFDRDRLAWISKEHMKRTDVDVIYNDGIEFLNSKEYFTNAPAERQSEEFIKKLIAVEKDRLETFMQIGQENQFFFAAEISLDKELLRWKENSDDETKDALTRALDVLKNTTEDAWTRENLEKALMDAAGEKRGDFLWPLRAALTGEKRSPSPFDCAWIFGRTESILRVENALNLF